MPNFDGGHYFLTVLAPIDDAITPDETGERRDGVQRVRNVLSTLPTARQSPASEAGSLNSPFARNPRTHFVRFAVIEDVIYNGRVSGDAIVAAATGDNPLTPQPVDRLNCPYLVFAADFDAADGSVETLEGYLRELWNDLSEELELIFRHCHGFKGVNSAEGFAAYICRCQVETTMPFNDYWVGSPPLSDLPLKPMVAPALVTGVIAIVAAIGWLVGAGARWGWTAVLAALVTAALLYGLYRFILHRGEKPYPTAPDSDLPAVLKALYLQERFTQFVIDQQGKPDEAVKNAFGQFLAANRPADIDAPTQARGVIRSSGSAS